MYCFKTLVMLAFVYRLKSEDEITFDGTQSISTSLIASPLNLQKNELGLVFRTTLSSCVLFFASGISGDYIALELYHGKLRYVANSNGLSTPMPVEIIHGENYADGELHQVNVEIDVETKLYTYSLAHRPLNYSSAHSYASDLNFDIDEKIYFMGIPIRERINAKEILLSTRNYEGCLNLITSFDKNVIEIKTLKNNQTNVHFHGYIKSGCNLIKPTYLKAFTKATDELPIFSHINERAFVTEFQYKTYLQTAVIFQSSSVKKLSSVTLLLRDNNLVLTVNITKSSSLQLSSYDAHFHDGNWRKILVRVTKDSILFQIDNQIIRQKFNKTSFLDFPNELRFGGVRQTIPGFIGCLKDVYIGDDRTAVNDVMRVQTNLNYEEKMCLMKDVCFPSRPCRNGGSCIQVEHNATCNCRGTGYKGDFCTIPDDQIYMESCAAYFAKGFKHDGIYTIKPGLASPFKVGCKMTQPNGPVTIIQVMAANNTNVFTGTDKDSNFYYHRIDYTASKHQINELIQVSTSCQQFFRYNCYQSTMLNSLHSRYSSETGVRWYSKHGYIRNYWSGTKEDEKACTCKTMKNCANSRLLCNCDMMDQKHRFDEGYIIDKYDLPISKIRVSIAKTNHRSAFTIGSLECTSNINPTEGTTYTNSVSNAIPTDQIARTTSASSNYHLDRNNDTELLINETKRKNTGFYIDSKYLYTIVVIVIAIILLLVVLYFRRRMFCCYHQVNAKPQIIEFKQELNRNNNKNPLLSSHDVSVNMDDFIIHGMKAYTTSYSDSSVSTIDPGRYYQEGGDSDTYSLQSNKSTLSIPRKGILKLKKDYINPSISSTLPNDTALKESLLKESFIKDSPEKDSRSRNINKDITENTVQKDASQESIVKKEHTTQKTCVGECILSDNLFQTIPPPPPPRKCDNHDPNRTKDPLAAFREGYNRQNKETTEGNNKPLNTSLYRSTPPLKEKVLHLSTSPSEKPHTASIEQYLKRDSNTSLRSSSSCTSSKDSETNSDTEGNKTLSSTQRQRSKSVRFSDERNLLLLRRPSFPENCSKITANEAMESHPFLVDNEQKTLV